MSDEQLETAELCLGVVTGAHGIRGGLRVHMYDPESSALSAGLYLTLRGPEGGEPLPVTLERVSVGAPARLVFGEITDRNTAETLRGWSLWIRRSDLPELAEDELYVADLVGRPAWTTSARGEPVELGIIVGLATNGAQPLLEVEWGKERWLVPALPQFMGDVSERGLQVKVPEGMLPDGLDAQVHA